MKHLPRALLLCFGALIAWRIVALGFSNHYAQASGQDDPAAAEKALAWNSEQPRAQLRQGLALQEKEPKLSATLLKASFREDPTQASPLVALAIQARDHGDQERAQELIRHAVVLEPANAGILKDVAGFWLARGNLETAMEYWSRALEAQPAEGRDLYPLFLKIAENPETLGIFRSFATSPPTWWETFYQEAARRALDVQTVRALYAMRREARGVPVSDEERAAYIRRLQKEDRTTEAYLVWINGLSETQQANLGILNNGGFELEPTNLGFDWHIGHAEHVDVSTAKTFGADGERALHLLFKRRDKPYSHLFQPLFLDPGTYRLTGKVRIDNLDSMGGLKWILRCTRPESSLLGESERFLGAGEWREFKVDFQVTPTCLAEEIQLVSAGTRRIEHNMSGGIWFDDMALRKILVPSASVVRSKESGTNDHGTSPATPNDGKPTTP